MKIAHFKKNAFHNVLGWLLPTLIFIILTPIMVKKLGVAGFGVVTLIQIVTGYMTILNFGFSEAIIKQIAENLEHHPEQVNRAMWAGLALFAGFGLSGAVILYALAGWLGMEILQIPPEMRAEAVIALRIGAFVFALQMLAEFYRGSAIGYHRFDIPNISRIVRISLSAILIILSLKMGGGLIAVMWSTLAGLVAGLVLNAVWMQRACPMRWVSGDYKHIFLELFHFSKHIFFVRISGMISSKISQFFLGTLSSIANVALYEVPTRVAETGSVVLNRILQVFYPGFSAMDKIKDKNRIRTIVFSVLSIQLFILMPLMLIVMLEGPTILAIWINTEFATDASGIINLVAISYFMSSLTNLPVFVAMSFGLPAIVSKYSMIRMVVTIVLVYPMVKLYGLVGAAWVLLLAELVSIPFTYETIRRIFDVNPYAVLLRPLLIHAIIGGTCYAIYQFGYRNSGWYTPLGVLVIGLIYPLLAFMFNATTQDDNKRLKKLVTVWR